MKKDIPIQQVIDVGIAIVPDEEVWQVYLINNKEEKLRHIMVCSRGYGEIEGEKTETSTPPAPQHHTHTHTHARARIGAAVMVLVVTWRRRRGRCRS